LSRPVDRVQRREEGGLRPLLVHGPAANEDLAEPGLVDDRGIKWRRRPLRRVGLLYVVHEVERDGLWHSCIQGREHAGVAVGLDTRGFLEAGIPGHPHHQIAALVHAAIFGGESWVLHPFLKAFDAFVVALLDLRLDAAKGRVGQERLRRLSHGYGWY